MIPLTADTDRVTPDGRVNLYETRDAGASWTARGDGLPQNHAYLTVLRQAFTRRGEGDALELYFGATSGDVFGTADAGKTWFSVATRAYRQSTRSQRSDAGAVRGRERTKPCRSRAFVPWSQAGQRQSGESGSGG